MKLAELEVYDKIVIQCHDNPDPDSISAGYALYRYFESIGKEVRLVYSGKLLITKPNIVMLIEALRIPIEYIEELIVDGLLITVDCQYGAGNVSRLSAKQVAIIDHHVQEVPVIKLQEIRNYLTSCATVVWDMLCEVGYEVNEHPEVAMALYYGLFTDSSSFIEIHHPLDKDMRDSLICDKQLLRRLRNAVLTLRELEIAGMALIRHSYNAANRYVMVKAQECDPNILGLISDFALQVDSVDVCIVYNEVNEGIKFSVRSCVREVMANELATYLANELGNGGGHIDRAAGFLSKSRFNELHEYLNYDEYFLRKLTEYYQSFEVIDVAKNPLDLKEFKHYKKTPTPRGFVKLSEVLPEGVPVIIRSLEADIECTVKGSDILIIDGQGAISIMNEERFYINYKIIEEYFDLNIEYFPRIRKQKSGKVVYLDEYTKKCMLKGDNTIHARVLEKPVKVFTVYSEDKYKYGQDGDYLAISESDRDDVYVIEQEIFKKTYTEIE